MFKRRIPLVAALLLLIPLAAPAEAGIWTGSCPVSVQVSFNSPIRLADTHPGYSISMSSFLPDTCVVTLDPLAPLRSTGGGGNGSSTLWSCSSVLASGSWSQSWTGDTSNPPSVSGSHVITGTWDDWVLEIVNPSLSFTGVAHLRLAPIEQLKTLNCATGSVSSISMVGVLVFQDPEL